MWLTLGSALADAPPTDAALRAAEATSEALVEEGTASGHTYTSMFLDFLQCLFRRRCPGEGDVERADLRADPFFHPYPGALSIGLPEEVSWFATGTGAAVRRVWFRDPSGAVTAVEGYPIPMRNPDRWTVRVRPLGLQPAEGVWTVGIEGTGGEVRSVMFEVENDGGSVGGLCATAADEDERATCEALVYLETGRMWDVERTLAAALPGGQAEALRTRIREEHGRMPPVPAPVVADPPTRPAALAPPPARPACMAEARAALDAVMAEASPTAVPPLDACFHAVLREEAASVGGEFRDPRDGVRAAAVARYARAREDDCGAALANAWASSLAPTTQTSTDESAEVLRSVEGALAACPPAERPEAWITLLRARAQARRWNLDQAGLAYAEAVAGFDRLHGAVAPPAATDASVAEFDTISAWTGAAAARVEAARLAVRTGRTATGARLVDEAMARSRALGDRRTFGFALIERARLRVRLGDHGGAAADAAQAGASFVQLRRADGVANALLYLGWVRYWAGWGQDLAAADLQRAEAEFRALGSAAGMAEAQLIAGLVAERIARREGDPSLRRAAEARADRAWQFYDVVADRGGQGRALWARAVIREDWRPTDAARDVRAALPLLDGDPVNSFNVLLLLTRLPRSVREKGWVEELLLGLPRAVDGALGGRIGDVGGVETLLAAHREQFHDLARQLGAGSISGARPLGAARGAAVFHLLAAPQIQGLRAALRLRVARGPDVPAVSPALSARLNGVYASLHQGAASADPLPLAELREKRTAELDQLVRGDDGGTPPLEVVQARLRAASSPGRPAWMLAWHLAEDSLLAEVVSADAYRLVDLTPPRPPPQPLDGVAAVLGYTREHRPPTLTTLLALDIGRVLGAMENIARAPPGVLRDRLFDAFPEDSLEALSDLLLTRVMALVPTGAALVLAPEGILHEVPWAALPIAGMGGEAPTPLGARHALVVVPGAAWPALEVPPARPLVAGSIRSLVVSADRALREATLPGARVEVASVARRLEPLGPTRRACAADEAGGLRCDAPPTRETFLGEAPAADVVHVASHGEARSHDWLSRNGGGTLSSLVLESPDGGPDRLWEHDLLDLPLTTDLVVLSACETAHAGAWDMEGGLGLGRAMLAAGARTVLASRWSIDDAATTELMLAFYDAYADGLANPADRSPFWKAAALQRAQEAARTGRWHHPYYWAAFSLLGSPG